MNAIGSGSLEREEEIRFPLFFIPFEGHRDRTYQRSAARLFHLDQPMRTARPA
jgi:hypothetical protein